jgi:short-subunit dehydrogenase
MLIGSATVRIEAGTRALVTGASSGIGRSVAHALARRGATVGLLSRSRSELEALAAELPGEHVVLPADVSDREAVFAAVRAFGSHDLCVANAGLAHYGPFLELDLDRVEQMTQVNWLGTVYTVRAALETGVGHLAIVSSGAALRTFPGAAAYGATKAAQRGFGEALRHELAGRGVGVTLVYPGEIATALHDHEKDAMPAWYRGGTRASSPDALAASFLAAVEADARAVHFPRLVRLLGIVHGISPRAADALLRRLRGSSAAPRR